MTLAARPWWVLPVIVGGQFLVTSTWFAANAVIRDLAQLWTVALDSNGGTTNAAGVGTVTIAVQLGFIAGTLIYAWLGVADRFSPQRVFLVSACLAALSNALVLVTPAWFEGVVLWRWATGFWLAGVYPVGMKIAASWFAEGLARALGYLVGALVLGTALPHLLRALHWGGDWRNVLWGVTLAALIGGVLVWRVPEGPHLKRGGAIHFREVLAAFRESRFRDAVLGYFGHMWELYALWTFVPHLFAARGNNAEVVSLLTFTLIACGAVGCVLGGLAALRWGSAPVACAALAISGLCCLVSPWLVDWPSVVALPMLMLWGVAVAADSPQLSTLNAQTAPRQLVGSALTFATCIGFGITVASIALLERLLPQLGIAYLFVPLAMGPAIGVWRLRKLIREVNSVGQASRVP